MWQHKIKYGWSNKVSPSQGLKTACFSFFSPSWLSHCCSDVRSVRSPAGSSPTEVGFTWQASSAETVRFPWEHICRLPGARAKVLEGNSQWGLRTRFNHTKKDSKFELWQDATKLKIPSKWNQERTFYRNLCCKHNTPNHLEREVGSGGIPKWHKKQEGGVLPVGGVGRWG